MNLELKTNAEIAEMIGGEPYARKCDFTGEPMNDGFYIEPADEYCINNEQLLYRILMANCSDELADDVDKYDMGAVISFFHENGYYYYTDWTNDNDSNSDGWVKMPDCKVLSFDEAVQQLESKRPVAKISDLQGSAVINADGVYNKLIELGFKPLDNDVHNETALFLSHKNVIEKLASAHKSNNCKFLTPEQILNFELPAEFFSEKDSWDSLMNWLNENTDNKDNDDISDFLSYLENHGALIDEFKWALLCSDKSTVVETINDFLLGG